MTRKLGYSMFVFLTPMVWNRFCLELLRTMQISQNPRQIGHQNPAILPVLYLKEIPRAWRVTGWNSSKSGYWTIRLLGVFFFVKHISAGYLIRMTNLLWCKTNFLPLIYCINVSMYITQEACEASSFYVFQKPFFLVVFSYLITWVIMTKLW